MKVNGKIKISPFLNCEETARLISLSRDGKIGRWRKIQVFLHLSMCDACTLFERFINKTGDLLNTSTSDEKMPPAMRDKLKKKLDKKPTK